MSKHTAGPWFLETRKSTCDGVCVAWSIDTATRVSIASAQSQEHIGPTGIHESECLANARLIAAAPDLLEALIACLDDSEESLAEMLQSRTDGHVIQFQRDLIAKARAAIAKATGGAA